MPELVDTDIIKVAKGLTEKTSDNLHVIRPEEIRKIVEVGNLEFVGIGAECIVVGHPSSENTVTAIDYRKFKDPKEAKRIFYTHRIFSTLFPHNFPHFYTSYGGQKDIPGGTIRQRVHAVDRSQKIFIPKFPFGNVKKIVEELKLPVWFEKGPANYLIASDGGQYYLDKIGTNDASDSWPTDQIDAYMKQNKFTDTDRRIIAASINRLQILQKA